VSANSVSNRYAIADGASDSIASRRWSKFLTRAWAECAEADATPELLENAVRLLGDRFQARWACREAPWYLAEKAQAGAFAAFLGVRLIGKTWEAVALGDCCLFHEQAHELRCSFPIEDPSGFTNAPILIPSSHRHYASAIPPMSRRSGSWMPGAKLTLMSDAIACWYLRERLARSRSATLFSQCILENDDESLRQLVSDERLRCRLRNDDVAILRIMWPNP
jgi:hypothetical protein